MTKFNVMKLLDRGAMFLALFLFAFFAISFGADYHWISERYTHTLPQYSFFGLIFFLYFAVQKYWKWASLMLMVVIISFYGTMTAIHYAPEVKANANPLKIAIYNKLYYLGDHREMEQWIKTENPDLIAIQEANLKTLEMTKTLESYPYVVHKLVQNPFGMIFLSKHPIVTSKIQDMRAGPQENFFIHALIQIENYPALSIYTVHTAPPVSHIYFEQRNKEFEEIIKAIKKDDNQNIVLLGDLNVTPYSPYFKNILNQTDLKNEYTSLMPPPTWTSFRHYIMQIPIDHILHKGDLHLVEKYSGPAMGSDHYPLIATFALQ